MPDLRKNYRLSSVPIGFILRKKRLIQTGSSLILLALASSVLACTYEEGNRDYKAKQYGKACACFMQPDKRENPKAQNTLGIMYESGLGVEKDLRKAVE